LSLDESTGIDLAHHRLNTEMWAGDDTDDTLSVGEAESDALRETDMPELADFKSDSGSRRRPGSQRKKTTTKRDSSSSSPTPSDSTIDVVPDVPASSDDAPGHSVGECPVLSWKVHEVSDWLRRAFLSQHIGTPLLHTTQHNTTPHIHDMLC
jgi:hypothetical protein